MMLYAVAKGTSGVFLQGIVPNEKYAGTATAPTMGSRHSYAEYSTVWGEQQKAFERLTAANYIKTLFEEFHWKDREPFVIRIIPLEEGWSDE